MVTVVSAMESSLFCVIKKLSKFEITAIVNDLSPPFCQDTILILKGARDFFILLYYGTVL
jgi:hypothetical protein